MTNKDFFAEIEKIEDQEVKDFLIALYCVGVACSISKIIYDVLCTIDFESEVEKNAKEC